MAGKKSDDGNSAAKKPRTRTKRPRLGRGLSALVDAPIAVEVEHASMSDNTPAVVTTPGRGGTHNDGGAVGTPGVNDGVGAGGGEARTGSVVDAAVDSAERAALVGDQMTQVSDNIDFTTTPASSANMSTDLGAGGERVVEIAVGVIGVNRDQPRREFDEEALAALAASISAHGVMQPIVVRRVSGVKEDGVELELIAGERRLRASKIAGLETVPAIVRDVDDVTSAQLALIENVQREDLNVVELAEGYRALADRYGMTQEKISKAVGVSRSSVANIVRLLELPEEVRTLISGGALSSGHGKVLLSLGSPEKQRKFAARAIKEGWNVRLLERAITDDSGNENLGGLPQGGGKPEDERALSVLRDLEVRVGEQLGTRVKIKTDKSRQKGRVVIEFYDLDQFDGLLGRLGVSMEG
jgi:ParB family transcriptional regulator, chromosome partitioning protein